MDNAEKRKSLYKGLEYLEAHPSETPKYFSQLEEKIEDFWGVADNLDECESIVRKTGRLMKNLNQEGKENGD